LKLDRAAKHIGDLETAIEDYFSGSPCAIVVEDMKVPNILTQAWTARIRKPVPTTLAPIIGDAVHNLRSSLDLLACDLVRLKGKEANRVHFPFCEKSEELKKAIKERYLNRAGSDVVRVITSLKPYRGGNLALRAIHDMDISDKHYALLPVIGAVSVPLGPILGAPKEFTLQEWKCLIQEGHMVIMLPDRMSPVRLGMELPARWFLAFGSDTAVGAVPVIECLHELSQAANSVFLALTALRPGAKFP
jgi:hypothetical protein